MLPHSVHVEPCTAQPLRQVQPHTHTGSLLHDMWPVLFYKYLLYDCAHSLHVHLHWEMWLGQAKQRSTLPTLTTAPCTCACGPRPLLGGSVSHFYDCGQGCNLAHKVFRTSVNTQRSHGMLGEGPCAQHAMVELLQYLHQQVYLVSLRG